MDADHTGCDELLGALADIEAAAEAGLFDQAADQLHRYDVAAREQAAELVAHDGPRWQALLARHQAAVQKLLSLRDAAAQSVRDLKSARQAVTSYHRSADL